MKTIKDIVDSTKTKEERTFRINYLNEKLWQAMLAERQSRSERSSNEVADDAARLVVAWWNKKESHNDDD